LMSKFSGVGTVVEVAQAGALREGMINELRELGAVRSGRVAEAFRNAVRRP
jgi:hypothetical protein